MRKFYFSILLAVVVFVSLSFESFNATAMAAEEETQVLTPAQIEEMNTVLEVLRSQANRRLEQGETSITEYGRLSFQKEPISLSFHVMEPRFGHSLPTAPQSKIFRTEVKNTAAGFDFGHTFTGSSLLSSGNVVSYVYYASLSDTFYSKKETTNATRLSPSAVDFSSTGSFKTSEHAAVEYNTHIKVKLENGTYRLTEAKLTIK